MAESYTSLELSRTYTSFGGVDIQAIVNGQAIAELQAISYAVQREKAPVYVMGRPDPLSFSRGKRGIAGTMISLMFDRHIIKSAPFADMLFVADNNELRPSTMDIQQASSENFLTEEGVTDFDGSDIGSNYTVAQAWYVDQLPPFDVVIAAVNEYGNAATMRIIGAEILNEGSGFSIDDMVIENQMTYVCRAVLPWQKLGKFEMGTVAPGSSAFKPE